ncbi:peroxiredoxin family protein [Priestia sp. LL-8]|uniref:peroxiredoxin family protein n=1 Tax=Priestia sp. LL-8 TaxID=3110068 RepID=UPI0015F53224|nr:redoxin domain-containing protein [Priestia sp. LL-8]MED5247479.1 redoxin domain-containing protein [Priestia sp. LL-8]
MFNLNLISHVLLWGFIIIQSFVIFLLTKLIVQFLNRFRLEGSKIISKGNKAPLFRETDTKGNLIRMSNFEKSWTLLVFIKDSCSVCKEAIPLLSDIKKNSARPLRILAIAPEEGESTIDNELDATINLIRSNDIINNYEVEEIPTYIIVDFNGVIIDIYKQNRISELYSFLGFDPSVTRIS